MFFLSIHTGVCTQITFSCFPISLVFFTWKINFEKFRMKFKWSNNLISWINWNSTVCLLRSLKYTVVSGTSALKVEALLEILLLFQCLRNTSVKDYSSALHFRHVPDLPFIDPICSDKLVVNLLVSSTNYDICLLYIILIDIL